MKKTYGRHCDGYYFDGACLSQGEIDVTEPPRRKHGWLQPSRRFCKSNGVSPFNNKICRHCVELKKVFK